MAELFSPQRLQLARQRRGLFMQELAARIGVTPKAVSEWENGKRTPTDENTDKLSEVLEFPKEFFFGDAPPTLGGAAFRSLARMTARQRDMALSAGSQAVALDMWIERHFKRPEPNVPDLRDSTPEGAAEAVRAAWGLGYRTIQNLVHLLEMNGVRVYSLVHDGTEVDAFSHWLGKTPFIFLNMTKTAERSRMDAAHELGHLVLHAHTGGGSTKKHEDEAQAFASALLMPRAPFLASAPRYVSVSSVIEAKQRWGVSAMAYVHRLHKLDRIREWVYRSLCIQIKSTFGPKEPGPLRVREASQVLAKVLAPSKSGGGGTTTRKEIAKLLRIYTRDLDELTFGLALSAATGGGRTVQLAGPVGGEIRLVK
jgi:Zn-dependent peptidase ImmA (M78 family)/DNA-binding XRE family transcriptional regulator